MRIIYAAIALLLGLLSYGFYEGVSIESFATKEGLVRIVLLIISVLGTAVFAVAALKGKKKDA